MSANLSTKEVLVFDPIKKINLALLGKWPWRIGEGPSGLWKQVLVQKYIISRYGWQVKHPSSRVSASWKVILRIKDSFYANIRFWVGSGHKSDWLGSKALKDVFPSLWQLVVNRDALVKDAWERMNRSIIWTLIF